MSEPASPSVYHGVMDVVRRDGDFVVFLDGKPMLTPRGREFSHANQRLLHHVVRDCALARHGGPGASTAAALFCAMRDEVEQGAGAVSIREDVLNRDLLARRRLGRAVDLPLDMQMDVLEFLESHEGNLDFIFGGMVGIVRALNCLAAETEIGARGPRAEEECLASFAQSVWERSDPCKKAGVRLLDRLHGVGVLLPLLLVHGRVTPSEYAGAAYNFSLPRVYRAIHSLPSPDQCPEPVFADWRDPLAAVRRARDQAAAVMEYLSFSTLEGEAEGGAAAFIRVGEGYDVEFKSTLRVNLHTMKKDPAIEHASLKTIAAFLNTDGGTLLVGVRDDGTPLGVGADDFPNEDKFALHFWNLAKASLGEDVCPSVRAAFETVADHRVFLIRCDRGRRPVFLARKGFEEEFYIRTGPSSTRLGIQDALRYISQHFPSA